MTALVAAAMLADLITFALAVPSVGVATELNPLVAAAYGSAGILAVAALKLAAIVGIVAVLRRIQRPPLRRGAAIFAASIGIVGAVANLTSWGLA